MVIKPADTRIIFEYVELDELSEGQRVPLREDERNPGPSVCATYMDCLLNPTTRSGDPASFSSWSAWAESPSSGSLSVGAKAGVGIGAAVILVAALAVGMMFCVTDAHVRHSPIPKNY